MSEAEDSRSQLVVADAKKLRGVLDAYDDIASDDHRGAAINDRLSKAIAGICAKHSASRACFTGAQTECLSEIAFQVAYILDPRNKAPRSLWGRLKREFYDASLVGRLGMLGVTVGFLVGVFALGSAIINGATWAAHRFGSQPAVTTTPSTSAPAPVQGLRQQ